MTKEAPRRIRLEVEVLEDRRTPAITYHGGALLAHVQAQALYLGSAWVSSPANKQLAGQLDGFVKTLVSGTYMDMLTTAGYNVGRGTASPGAFDPLNIDPTSVLSDDTIQSDLQYAINAKLVQQPTAETLYVIYVEPNISVGMDDDDAVSANDFLGYHSAFVGTTASKQPADIRYAVLPYPGGSVDNLIVPNVSAFQSLTVVSSHEIVESCTDPDVEDGVLGWYDETANEEIADVVNLEFVVWDGYAVQRIADTHGQAMTPLGAEPLEPVSFEVLQGGNLYEHTASGWTFIHDDVASVSSQGIDNNGLAMVDVVLTNGYAYEYHDGGDWTPLMTNVAQACAGQGVSYVLTTDGRIYEYHDDSGAWSGLIASNIRSISAGTDRYGANLVAAVNTRGIAYMYSDSTGAQALCSNATAISAGTEGYVGVVQQSGVAYEYNETTGGWTYLSSNVTQLALGTEPTGAVMVDLIVVGGTAKEYRVGTGWVTLCTGVAAVGKANAGVVAVVLTNGSAYDHSSAGWTPLTTTVAAAT